MRPEPEVILKRELQSPPGAERGVDSSLSSTAGQRTPRIVVVGGGAGGLELVTRLGDRLGRRGRAHVTLIDAARSHVWKPLLHEFAAGTLGIDDQALDYIAQAHWHHFEFRLGAMEGLDRERREVIVAPSYSEEGEEVTPRRRFGYDTLVIAVGSTNNDFGTPGVREHTIRLETKDDAGRFHRRLIDACLRANSQSLPSGRGAVSIAVVGGGATGVELCAELHNTMRVLASYGSDGFDPDRNVRIVLIEAGQRILPALPERLSTAAHKLLDDLGIEVMTGRRVTGVDAHGVLLDGGERIDADLRVWAAGIKAPDFLKEIGGLETNRINQLVVRDTLQTTRDDAIFALGDCAAAPLPDGKTVPPRAQAAHQQASLLARSIPARVEGKPLPKFRYRDFGSLVSFGKYNAIGNVIGQLTGRNLWVDGLFARLMYWSLYRMHLLALHGVVRVALDTLADWITRRHEPRVKLH
jgi:NADH:ubiquinone reductase (H+-translocating)